MASEGPLIVTSVHSHVVEDLADGLRRGFERDVEIRTAVDAATWIGARGGGRVASLRMRVRGFLFPLWVDLGPRDPGRAIIATTNPFLLPAVVALRRPRARLVTIVYDLYPESLEVRVRLPWPVRTILRAVTRFGLRRSAAVVFLGERTRDHVVASHGLACPTAVIPPGSAPVPRPAGPPPSLEALSRTLEGRVVISYVGNIGSVHDASTVAEAIRRVLASRDGRCAVVLSARGDRAEELLGPLVGLPDVTVLGPLDADEWAWVTHRSDIALASLDARAGLVSLPSKVFASLSGGAAILAIAPEDSDLAALVRGSGAGLVTPPGDAQAASAALQGLVDDGAARRGYAERARTESARFTPEALAVRWAELLARIG